MKKDLETIYEDMMSPFMLRVVRQTSPLSPVKIIHATKEEMEDDESEEEEDLTEKEEIEISREILSCVSELDDIAKDAMYRSYRNKIEKIADNIRELASNLIKGHGKKI